jgi:hypothetical protein
VANAFFKPTSVTGELIKAVPGRESRGTLTKFAVVLEPQKLSDDEQRRLRDELAKALTAVQ